MTTTQLAALIALAYLTLAIATATAICAYLEHGKRRAPDPFDTITAWRDDIGRDEQPPLLAVVARLYVTAAAEAEEHAHEVVAEAEAILRGAR